MKDTFKIKHTRSLEMFPENYYYPFCLEIGHRYFRLFDCCCLYNRVNSQLMVRVCDSALSRDFFPLDYQCLAGESEKRPVKWLAIESLSDRKFSTASEMVSSEPAKWSGR